MGGWLVSAEGETIEQPRWWPSFRGALDPVWTVAGNGQEAIKVFADRQVTVAPIGCAGRSEW